MRRTIKMIVLSLILVILCSIAFVACDDEFKVQVIDSSTDNVDGVAGTFYTLQEAYNLGIIGVEEIKSIAYYQNVAIVPELVQNKEYNPIEKIPSQINDEDNKNIRKTWAKQWKKNDPKLLNYVKSYKIEYYHGTYNNAIAVVTSIPLTIHNPIKECRTIEGMDIWYANSMQRVLIWVEEERNLYGNYTLQEAYDVGILDMQALKSIVYHCGDESQVETFGENFVPTPIDESLLTKELKDMALQALIKDIQRLRPAVSPSIYGFQKCVGTFNGAVVYYVEYLGGGWQTADVIRIEVEGIEFYASSPYKIRVFKAH